MRKKRPTGARKAKVDSAARKVAAAHEATRAAKRAYKAARRAYRDARKAEKKLKKQLKAAPRKPAAKRVAKASAPGRKVLHQVSKMRVENEAASAALLAPILQAPTESG